MYTPLSQRIVDMPVIVIGEREIDDDSDRYQSPLYRNFEPNFEKSMEEGQKALARLKKRYTRE